MVKKLSRIFPSLFLLSFFFLTIFPTKTYACSCAPPGPALPFYNDIKNIINNNIVFIGKVEQIEPISEDSSVSNIPTRTGGFMIPQTFYRNKDLVTISNAFPIKGTYKKTWTSKNAEGGSSCSFKFPYELNKYYVIFGSGNTNSGDLTISTGPCERVTALLEEYQWSIFYQLIYTIVPLSVLFFLTKFLVRKLKLPRK